jgi:dTDP-4-amino-4,6-dideoxygalactose transaminase
MGLSPSSLKFFLENNTKVVNKKCINKNTNKEIKGCLPMHSYGHPCRIEEIKEICDEHYISLIEDAAESLGSFYKGKHTGTFGEFGAFSFNGNKIITAGGGGCIVTNNELFAKKAKHLTSTAKIPHKWDFKHDMVGYNYRMPNLNAALLLAQLENLNNFIINKRKLAGKYEKFFKSSNYKFFKEPQNCKSNYWLNSIILKNKRQRDIFLKDANSNNIMVRPIWKLMNRLPMFKNAQCGDLKNSEWLFDRVVNLPSSITL